MTLGFEGFNRQGMNFLAELREHNDRAWFTPRKAEYERLLKEPLEDLCRALAARFGERGIPLVVDPRRSPFRIYRDVRFSRDKTPYKPFVSASFPYAEVVPAGPDVALVGSDAVSADRPAHVEARGSLARHAGGGGYFHFGPGEIYLGGGVWHPERPWLAAWRALIASDGTRIHAAVDDPAFVREFGELDGERLTRVPTGFAPDHPDASLLRLKDVTFGRHLSDDEAFSPDLPDTIAGALATAVPLLRLLASLTTA
jgi:uncharacterized protein (DUF2461 family)